MDMVHEITCINCPLGCRVKVVTEGEEVLSVAGNRCKRGDAYARQECVRPMRMLTAAIPCRGSSVPLSVRTHRPIPRDMLGKCMEELMRLEVSAPVEMGSVLCRNILGTGADIIATRDLALQEEVLS